MDVDGVLNINIHTIAQGPVAEPLNFTQCTRGRREPTALKSYVIISNDKSWTNGIKTPGARPRLIIAKTEDRSFGGNDAFEARLRPRKWTPSGDSTAKVF